MPEQAGDVLEEKNLDYMIGVKDVFIPESEIEVHTEEILRLGYTVLEDAISEEDLGYLDGKLEKIYETQLDEVGGEEVLKKIGDQYSAKHLITYDDFYLKLILNERVISITKEILGEYFILHWNNAILNFPGLYNPASAWHRDIAYQEYTTSKPLSLTALFILDDFSEETGGTIILPGSHLIPSFPSKGFAAKHGQQVVAKAGTVVLFNSWMYHQAGYNQSQGIRRAIANVYTSPMIKQQISFPKLLDGKYSDNPYLKKLFGYECETADSVLDYRLRRLKNRGDNYLTDKNRIGDLKDYA